MVASLRTAEIFFFGAQMICTLGTIVAGVGGI